MKGPLYVQCTFSACLMVYRINKGKGHGVLCVCFYICIFDDQRSSKHVKITEVSYC